MPSSALGYPEGTPAHAALVAFLRRGEGDPVCRHYPVLGHIRLISGIGEVEGECEAPVLELEDAARPAYDVPQDWLEAFLTELDEVGTGTEEVIGIEAVGETALHTPN